MAVMLDTKDAKKAMAVVRDVTSMESQQCFMVDDTSFSTWPSA